MNTKPRSDAFESKTGWVVKETLYKGPCYSSEFEKIRGLMNAAAAMKDPEVDIEQYYDDMYYLVICAFRDATPEEIEIAKAARASREKLQEQMRREQFEKLKVEFEGK